MSKILIIGVGDAGRNTVKHMKDSGMPDTDFVTFGAFEDCDGRKDIPHYNLITMNIYAAWSDPGRLRCALTP